MSLSSETNADVSFYLQVGELNIRLEVKAGVKTFRQVFAEVGKLAKPLSQGEIVAVELLTQQSHDIHVPPAAALQLDERITKQYANKSFRLVWRERLSADSDDDEEDFIAPKPVSKTQDRKKIQRADSETPNYLRQLNLNSAALPSSPRRSSISYAAFQFSDISPLLDSVVVSWFRPDVFPASSRLNCQVIRPLRPLPSMLARIHRPSSSRGFLQMCRTSASDHLAEASICCNSILRLRKSQRPTRQQRRRDPRPAN